MVNALEPAVMYSWKGAQSSPVGSSSTEPYFDAGDAAILNER